jgi:hypothetical protein
MWIDRASEFQFGVHGVVQISSFRYLATVRVDLHQVIREIIDFFLCEFFGHGRTVFRANSFGCIRRSQVLAAFLFGGFNYLRDRFVIEHAVKFNTLPNFAKATLAQSLW